MLFNPLNISKSKRHQAVYAAFEIAYTLADFLAAMLFLIGSILFFYASMQNIAIWCFIFGSALFALKPTLRLIRELRYLAMGDVKTLAERAEGEGGDGPKS